MLDSPAANMMKECLQFLIEPAKKLKIRLKVLYCPLYSDRTTFARSNRLTSLPFYSVFFPQESRKRVKLERKEPLVESQLFIMELARELNKICQVSPQPL